MIAENLLDRLREFRQEIALRETIAVIPERKSALRMALSEFDRVFPEAKTFETQREATVEARKEIYSGQLAERFIERIALCPDHRDKATGRCIVCVAEERTRGERRSEKLPARVPDRTFKGD
jgi:hypothetical protein